MSLIEFWVLERTVSIWCDKQNLDLAYDWQQYSCWFRWGSNIAERKAHGVEKAFIDLKSYDQLPLHCIISITKIT